MKQEYAEQVAAKIIEQLQQGTAPWLKPWQPGELRLPYNPKTGSEYRGMNSMWLHMQGHADPRWMTYNQAASEDAQVRKGEKGTQIVYWKFTDEKKAVDDQGKPIIDPETGKQKTITVKLERPRSFSAVVFNAEQIDGLPPLEARPIRPEPERHARAEAILTASGANIQHIEGDRAFYSPARDSITLPLRSQFESADAYYATALHETGHWTGHPSRLDRDLSNPFGSEGYAREELRAEIASLMLGERLEIGHDPAQHVAYIGSWVKILEEDPREIFRAAADAERIAGFVMEFEKEIEQTVTNENVSEPKQETSLDYYKQNQAVVNMILADITKGEEYDHVGYTVLYATNIPAGLSSDEEIESEGDRIRDVIETGNGFDDPKNAFIFDAIQKLTQDRLQDQLNEIEDQLSEQDEHYSNQTLDALVKNHGWEVAYSDLHQKGQVDAVGRMFDGVGPLGTMNTPNGERRLLAGYGADPDSRRYIALTLGDKNIIEIDGRKQSPDEAAKLINSSAEVYADQERVKKGLEPIYAPPETAGTIKVDVPKTEIEPAKTLHHVPSPETTSPQRTYLAVPYLEKEEAKAAAKAAGFQLKWDKEAKSWYAPEGANLEAVKKWSADNDNVLKDTAPTESVEAQFSKALKEAGLKVDGLPKMDGQMQRVPTLDDKPGALSGAYVGHLTGITAGGYIQNHKSGEVIHWKPEGSVPELTPEQRAEQAKEAQQQYDARQAFRSEQHEATAKAAQALWNEAPEATPDNQYCKAKGMLNPAASGLRTVPHSVSPETEAQGIKIAQTAKEAKALREANPNNRVFKAGDLLVPCYDMEGKLWSLQSVNPYFKSLMKNGRKAGLFSVVGAKNPHEAFEKMNAEPAFPLVLGGEGVATADTVSRLMKGRPIFLAIDSGNIDAVAQQFRERNPERLLLIAADNDHQKSNELDEHGRPKKNVGLVKAQEAAEKHGAGLMIPKFDKDEKGSDWNDLAANRGDSVAQRMLADEFIVAKRDAAIAAERMISLARSREMEARDDPSTSADDAYIASERGHAADMIAEASRHVNNINTAISDGKVSTKGTTTRAPASVKAAVNSKSVSMNEKVKAERQDVTYEHNERKPEETAENKPKKARSRGFDMGM